MERAPIVRMRQVRKSYGELVVLKQLDLARTLDRIGALGPDGFYRGRTAELIE